MDRVTRNTINKSQRKISSLKELTGQDRSKKFNIPFLLDELHSSSSGFSGNKLTSSATPTVTELETDVGALAGKVNLIIRALKEQNIIR
jgi:hypothetical protein|tara:strand:- start:407 stop:673 length:267 start_codon:yes stop_codon:yes gene_type:complete